MIAQADMSSEAETARLLNQIREDMPPLRGVIHAAGVFDDGLLRDQRWSRFAAVMAPKVYGGHNLHQLTRDDALDFFILYSSVASLLGSPGLGSYAAANAFLDALAWQRRQEGRPAVSINWGPWASVGRAAAMQLSQWQHWQAQGLRPIDPSRGFSVLGMLLQEAPAQVGVFPVSWPDALGHLAAEDVPPLLRGFVTETGTDGPVGQAALVVAIAVMQPEKRRAFLSEHIERRVASILGLDASHTLERDRPLTELGLDSLMAVELSNALSQAVGRKLSATLLFEYPSIDALTGYLLSNVLKLEQRPVERAANQRKEAEILAEINQLTESEIVKLIDEELNALM